MTTSYVAQDDLPTETMTPNSGKPPSAPRKRRMSNFALSGVSTAVLLIVFVVIGEVGARADLWSDRVMPAPSIVLTELGRLLGQAQFWQDAARTGVEVAFAIVLGSLFGFAAGLIFWKLPAVGRIFEPYLVSFYAVPLVLFYPVMIVLVGINATSVIILATVMAAIPMALNTAVGLNSMPPVYMKLARSVTASPRQTLFAIAIPAAGPFIVAGLRLAVVYALIGTIAMEFTTAQAGLGYRIRYLYEIFNNNEMFAYIAVVLVLSCILTALLAVVERVLLRGRNR
ncbi:ABC transporter permease [Mycobacterium sp. NPDC003449]